MGEAIELAAKANPCSRPLGCGRRRGVALLACSLLVNFAGSTAARAQPIVSAVSLSEQAAALAARASSEWTTHETADGWLIDPVVGPLAGSYGVGMIGQAMVEDGVAQASPALVEDGLRAELAEIAHPDGGGFELMGLAEAYAWNRAHLGANEAWQVAAPAFVVFLSAHQRLVSDAGACYSDRDCYDNLKLVAAVAELALVHTGLRGSASVTLLGDPPRLRRRALATLEVAARYAGTDAVRVGADGAGASFADAGILSDPPQDPLAYHALSTLMLGRAVMALGSSTPSAIFAAFSRTARALLGLMAPDGNVAYIGRGQGQVWTVAATVDALAIAAAHAPDPLWRGRYLAGVALELQRLRRVYTSSGWGFPLVPRLADVAAQEAAENYLGVDGYANTVEYNGLALWALDNATSILGRTPAAPAQMVPSQTNGVFLDPSHTRFAAVTRGRLWFAVHGADSNLEDARYGFGLVAAELRTPSGWMSVLPPRPLTSSAQTGGVVMLVGGRRLDPIKSTLSATPAGKITVHGGWGENPDAKPAFRAVWIFRPTGDGVAMSFRTHAGCTYQFQVWYATGAQLSSGPNRLTAIEPDGSTQTYSFNAPITMSAAGAFHSAYADELSSSVLTIAPGHARVLRYTTTMGARP